MKGCILISVRWENNGGAGEGSRFYGHYIEQGAETVKHEIGTRGGKEDLDEGQPDDKIEGNMASKEIGVVCRERGFFIGREHHLLNNK